MLDKQNTNITIREIREPDPIKAKQAAAEFIRILLKVEREQTLKKPPARE